MGALGGRHELLNDSVAGGTLDAEDGRLMFGRGVNRVVDGHPVELRATRLGLRVGCTLVTWAAWDALKKHAEAFE